jgi:hypothetical protein
LKNGIQAMNAGLAVQQHYNLGIKKSPSEELLMKRHLLLAVVLITHSVTSANANLIVNGSFETPLVPVGGFTTFPAGSMAIPGWTVVGIDVSVISESFMQSGITFQSQHGDQWLDAAAFNTNSMLSGVTQDIATTANGQYEISFYVGSATDGVFFFPATIDLSINGGPRTSYTNPTAPNNMLNWRQFTVPFTAAGAVTNITLYNGGQPNNFLSALDNVSVVAIPEPCSVLLALIGLLSLARLSRRELC